jgi:hypothetical protein
MFHFGNIHLVKGKRIDSRQPKTENIGNNDLKRDTCGNTPTNNNNNNIIMRRRKIMTKK